ncbi:MAG: methylated-DNA--[protein]-cysteine S-methyltransferase [Firmicutes bacterium]|nr:methylated-DNA--[protein]-cysteine S-methyltransferase [Bacillota bacterium]
MEFSTYFDSPLGTMLLNGTESTLTGAWFVGQRYAGRARERKDDLPLFSQAKAWLNRYFAGERPGEPPPLAPAGSPFRLAAWELLLEIPYGETVTYGALAAELARRQGKERMSAQAAGGAVGHNPISIFIPCHRVVGADGSLTGYAGGVERKRFLLTLESQK